ncbi:hypothetical protein ACH4GZ_10520 [Streptomyces hygroscopicus]|uniref:hypothetical protein n=1 Tax=Streptomyces hygroscopicus TaxID=1912 RepID=UPI0037B75F41
MVSNVGTVMVRLRLPSLRETSMGALAAAFAVRCRGVLFAAPVDRVAFFACEVFEVFEVFPDFEVCADFEPAAAVRDFADVPPPRAGDVFFAAAGEPRLRDVVGVVTDLTSTR